MEKKLSEITRKDWIVYQWLESSELGEDERVFIRGCERTPDEAIKAADEWDFLQEVKEENEGSSESDTE